MSFAADIKTALATGLAPLRAALAARADSWANALTGVGTALGKANLGFVLNDGDLLDLVTLENLYNFDGLAARVVRCVPQHALRHGVTFTAGDPAQVTALHDALATLRVVEKTRLAWTWGRLYGGGALFLGCDDGRDAREPLDVANLRAIRWVVDVDRRDLYPETWESDPLDAGFGMPRTYTLTRMGGTAAETITVHASRLIRFEGSAPTRRRRLMLQGWGESVLQRVFQELQQVRGGFEAAAVLLQEASVGVMKIRDLHTSVASDDDDTFKKRMQLVDMSRSVARAILLDSEGESFERTEVGTLTGVCEVTDRQLALFAAVGEIPVSVLMGESPGGLARSGDDDISNWDDTVDAEREAMVRPRLERFARLLCLSHEGPTGGRVPAGLRAVFPPLRRPTPLQQAQLRKTIAETDHIYLDDGVTTAEEVATSRFPAEGYSAETVIDLGVRRAMQAADRAAAADHAPPAPAVGPARPARPAPPKADTRMDGTTGVAVVFPLPPDVAARVAVPGGERAVDLHLTLAFLGETALAPPAAWLADLRAVVAAWAAATPPLPATLLDGGLFFAQGDGPLPIYASVDCPALALVRQSLLAALAAARWHASARHVFVPHVTLAYVTRDTPRLPDAQEPIRFTFTEAALWCGDVRETYPLAAAPDLRNSPVAGQAA